MLMPPVTEKKKNHANVNDFKAAKHIKKGCYNIQRHSSGQAHDTAITIYKRADRTLRCLL